MPNELKKDLAHVYWIGGSPCSGKSTIAEMLAARYDLRLYSIDEHYDDHFLRGVTVEFPAFAPHEPTIGRCPLDAFRGRAVTDGA